MLAPCRATLPCLHYFMSLAADAVPAAVPSRHAPQLTGGPDAQWEDVGPMPYTRVMGDSGEGATWTCCNLPDPSSICASEAAQQPL